MAPGAMRRSHATASFIPLLADFEPKVMWARATALSATRMVQRTRAVCYRCGGKSSLELCFTDRVNPGADEFFRRWRICKTNKRR